MTSPALLGDFSPDPLAARINERVRRRVAAHVAHRATRQRDETTLGGLARRVANRADVATTRLVANALDMFGADPTAAQLRTIAQGTEDELPDAQTTAGKLASAAGYVAPQAAATYLGARALLGVGAAAEAGGLYRAARVVRALSGGEGAGIVRRNVGGAIAAAPLITVPGALSDDPTASTSGALAEALPEGSMLGRAVRTITRTKPGRLAADLAIDAAAGSALDAGLHGVGAAARGTGRAVGRAVDRAASALDVGEGMVDDGAAGLRDQVKDTARRQGEGFATAAEGERAAMARAATDDATAAERADALAKLEDTKLEARRATLAREARKAEPKALPPSPDEASNYDVETYRLNRDRNAEVRAKVRAEWEARQERAAMARAATDDATAAERADALAKLEDTKLEARRATLAREARKAEPKALPPSPDEASNYDVETYRLNRDRNAEVRAKVRAEWEARQERAAIAEEPPPLEDLTARTPGGRLPANLGKAETDALGAELLALHEANSADEGIAQGAVRIRGSLNYADDTHAAAPVGDVGVHKTNAAVNAAGRIAARRQSIARIEEELASRGVKPEDALWMASEGEAADGSTAFDFGANVETSGEMSGDVSGARRGAISPALVTGLAEAGAGGAVGGSVGDSPEERARNAALGAAAATGLPIVLSAAARRLRTPRPSRFDLDAEMFGTARGPEFPPSATAREVRATVDAMPRRTPPEMDDLPPVLARAIAGVRDLPTPGERRGRTGAVTPALLGQVAGTGAGAAAGGTVGDTPEERAANAVIGAGLAAGAGAVARRAFKALPERAALRAPMEASDITAPKMDTAPVRERPVLKPAETPSTGDVEPADFAKLSTFYADPDGQSRVAQHIEQVVRTYGLAQKQPVTWDQTRQVAASLGLKADAIAQKTGTGRLSGAELLALRNVYVENAAAEGTLLQRRATAEAVGDQRTVEMIDRTLGAVRDQSDRLLARFTSDRSAKGRDLNALKILASQTFDPLVWFSRAQKMLGDRPLTDETRATILKHLKARDADALARTIGALREVTPTQKALALWKAGLLTGVPTHLGNLIGNTTMAALESAKDAPAAFFDRLLFTMTGVRTKDFAVGATAQASWKGARRGVREAMDILRGQQPENALARYDFARETNFDNALLNVYTKAVFRSLSASDRVFRSIALERSLAEQARVLAKQSGGALNVEGLLRSPTDEMVFRAIQDAELATFNNSGRLSRAMSGLQRVHPAVEVILPFARTPANVAERTLEYSPMGAAFALTDLYRLLRGKGEREALQRKVVERLGRSSVGAAAVYLGYELAGSGRMTGGYPEDAGEREAWQMTGKIENAVKVGDRWLSLNRVSPLGNLIALGANLHSLIADPSASPASVAAGGAVSIARTLTEQPFLTGVSDFVDAMREPERRGAEYASRLVGSLVPNVVARAASASDPVVRDATGRTFEEAVTNALRARTPGGSRRLPAKLDAFGQPRTRDTGVVPYIDPFNSRVDQTADDPVLRELSTVGADIGRPKRRNGESPDAFRARRATEGAVLRRALEAVIASPEYEDLESVAVSLVERRAEGAGGSASALATEFKRSRLEEVIKRVRSQLSRSTRTRATR